MGGQIDKINIADTGETVEVLWEDGKREAFLAAWLRDNCSCSQCRHTNGQKLTNIGDFPADISLASAECKNGDLRVAFVPDNHTAYFDSEWLRACYEGNSHPPPPTLWDAQTLTPDDIARDYTAVSAGGAALADWLGLVVRYGCAILRGTPEKSATVCDIVEWFGFVRETNYGRWFEVRAVVNPNNLAYTGMGLSVHTDNPYRDPPPGLQLLHCLQNSAAGGDSVLVDGFMAAKILADKNPVHAQILADYAVPFRFADTNADLRNRLPVLMFDATGDLSAVNYNNRSIGALDMPTAEQPAYYAAYRHFSEILMRPQLNLTFKLQSGDLFIVDNRRVLHGRTAFSGAGGRYLQGCYADRDAFLSTWRILSGAVK